MEKNKNRFITILVLLWAVVPGYFFAINTFSDSWDIPLTFAQSLLTLFVLNFSSYSFGNLFFRAAKIDIETSNLISLYKIATGFGIIFISLLAFGMFGLYTPAPLTAFISILIIASIPGAYGFINKNFACSNKKSAPLAGEGLGEGYSDSIRKSTPSPLSPPVKGREQIISLIGLHDTYGISAAHAIIIAFIGFFVILCFLPTLTPPTGRDALIHHLSIPKLYLKNGGIVPIEHMSFLYRSLNLNLLYVLALFLKNDILAKVIHFNFYLLSVAALYRLLCDSFTKSSALISTLLFASIPVVFNTADRAYVDLAMTFFAIMLLNAIIEFHRRGRNVSLILGGIMAGLCASTKINGYLFILLMTLWLISVTQRKKYSVQKLMKALFIFFLFAFIFDAHMLVKNAIQTKNPFYPFLSKGLIPTEEYRITGPTSQLDEVKISPLELRRQMYGMTLIDELSMPWAISTESESKGGYTVDGVLGPVFIIFIPFFFFIRKRRYELLSLFAVAAIYVAINWLMWGIRLRYLIILFPIGAYLISAVIDEFFTDSDSARKSRISPIVLTMILSFIISMNIYHISDYLSIKEPFAYLTGKLDRQEYLTKHYKAYSLFMFLNSSISAPNARIYFLDFGKDTYYCDVDHFYDDAYLGSTLNSIVKASKDTSQIVTAIKERDITHILMNTKIFNEDLANNYNTAEKEMLYNFFTYDMKIVRAFGENVLFEANQ